MAHINLYDQEYDTMSEASTAVSGTTDQFSEVSSEMNTVSQYPESESQYSGTDSAADEEEVEPYDLSSVPEDAYVTDVNDGFVTFEDERKVVIICRTCLRSKKVRNLNWDYKSWLPLIADKCFLEWLVHIPSEREKKRAVVVSVNQMRQLEDLWRKDKKASVDELPELKDELDNSPENVKIAYADGHEYQKIFVPLLNLESELGEKLKKDLTQQDVEIHWEKGLNARQWVAKFLLRQSDTDEFRIVLGDEVKIEYPSSMDRQGAWSENGKVIRKFSDGEINVALNKTPRNFNPHNHHGYKIEFIWKTSPYDLMKGALKLFSHNEQCISAYLYHSILGQATRPQKFDRSWYSPLVKFAEDKTALNAPHLPELNHSQCEAVRQTLERPLTLIQGPPGTGKTVTSASVVYHLAKIVALEHKKSKNKYFEARKKQKRKKQNQLTPQVLVCAPSNIAVDQLASQIHKTGLKVVRIVAKSREDLPSFIDFLTLHYQVRQVAKTRDNELWKLLQLKDKFGELIEGDEKKFRHLMKLAEQELIQYADVVCTTCVGAGSTRLRALQFKHVLIDESTQAVEPECLIPLVKSARQVVLVGDHCQLGPVVLCGKAASAGLTKSLFERLIVLDMKPIRLEVQYRMHPALSEFPSNTFYEGSLQNGVSDLERTNKLEIFPNPHRPLFFYCSFGQEEYAASGTSFLNQTEAIAVEKIVASFIREDILPKQIGIITPYEGQRQFISEHLLQAGGAYGKSMYEGIEIASVDAFQGREKDYIILSCVRSNEHQGIGFLRDSRRLNVALTRAKFGLILVGNPKSLSKNPLWYELLTYFKTRNLLMEGPIMNMEICRTKLYKPRQFRQKNQLRHAQPKFADSSLYVDSDLTEKNTQTSILTEGVDFVKENKENLELNHPAFEPHEDMISQLANSKQQKGKEPEEPEASGTPEQTEQEQLDERRYQEEMFSDFFFSSMPFSI